MAVVQYTFTHKQYTEQHKTHNIQNNTKIRKSADRAPSMRVLPWHLFYSWGKSTEKLRCVCPSVRLSVRPSAWNKSAPTGRIFKEILYLKIFLKYVEKIAVWLKSDDNNRYFTRRPIYIFNHISLISSYNEKCFRQKLQRKSKHTFCV